MIRYTFYFPGEGTVKTDVVDDPAEDTRILDTITKASSKLFKGSRVLVITGSDTNIYVNLDLVKCITREVLPDDAPLPKIGDTAPTAELPKGA